MLFRQLCGSVIDYINHRLFRKKIGAALAGRQEWLRRLFALLIISPLVFVGVYGLYFCFQYYHDYKIQHDEMGVQATFLRKIHVGGVDLIALASAETQSSASKGGEAISGEKALQAIVERAKQDANRLSDEQKLFDIVSQWERTFRSEFSIVAKITGGAPPPHPLHVIYYDSLEKSGFGIVRFYERRKMKVPAEPLVKMSAPVVDGFREAIGGIVGALPREGKFPKALDFIRPLIESGSDSFEVLSERLAAAVRQRQSDFNDARRRVLAAEASLRGSLTANRIEQASTSGTSEAQRKRRDDILKLSAPVEESIGYFEAVVAEFVFDPWRLDTWTAPELPAQRLAKKKITQTKNTCF